MWIRNIAAGIALALLTVLAPPAVRGVITVTPAFGPDSYEVTPVDSNLYDVTLWCDPGEESGQIFAIATSNGQDSIRDLTFIVSDVPERSVSASVGTSQSRIVNVEYIGRQDESVNTSFVRANSTVTEMYLSGTLGRVSMITTLTAVLAGDVTGPIELEATSHTAPTLHLTSTTGSLLSDVILYPSVDDERFGRIHRLDFAGGTIGPVDGKNAMILADDHIRSVTAKEIAAEFGGTLDTNNYFTKEIADFETVTAGGGSGRFLADSVIRAERLRWQGGNSHFMRFGDEMKGTILLDNLFEGSGNEITMPEKGLRGRIIINAHNDSLVENIWEAPIIIGEGAGKIVLIGNDSSYPALGEYPEKASDLGGGTIGVVPFRLHRTDCDPAHESVIDWDNATNKACMRHYGPVTWDTEDGEPYKVERRKAGSSDSWQEQACFTCEPDEDNDTIVWVKTAEAERFHRGFEYRVSLRTRTSDSQRILRCNLTAIDGGTPQVANFDPLTFSPSAIPTPPTRPAMRTMTAA